MIYFIKVVIMNRKCSGCGALLQSNNIDEIGYVKNIDSDVCERCFRINNYNEYKKVVKSNSEYLDILKEIGKTNDLVLLVVDIFNLPHDFDMITKELNNNILLVLTKRDLLPKKVSDDKLLDYMNRYHLKTVDKVIISSNKNYNFDLLFDKINEHKKSNNVYVIGYTNAGKSTLINKIIYNYTDLTTSLTTSMLPSTTIDSLEIRINSDLVLIDTPGIIDEGNITDVIDSKLLKKILPKKEIKPITYQIRGKQFVLIDNILKIEAMDTNLTFYLSNSLSIDRYYKNITTLDDLDKRVIEVNRNNDVVIKGLGFIKCVNKCKLTLYISNDIEVFVRNSLI